MTHAAPHAPTPRRAFPRGLPAALLALALTGCFGGAAPLPRYTVADPEPAGYALAPEPAPAIAVRMAPDLRAAVSPTLYRADGTVSSVRGLTYYASLELAIARALRETRPADLGLTSREELALTIHDYCVDERTQDGTPVARVALTARSGPSATATEPLPPAATPGQIRAALARCLRAAVREATLK